MGDSQCKTLRHTSDSARTHRSMPVLSRHSRHMTGGSRSGAKQLQGTKQPRAKQPRKQNRRAADDSLTAKRRRRPAAPPCPSRPTAAALLTADPCKSARTAGTPPLLPLPPGEALLRAAHAPPQAGHRLRRPAAPPRPRSPRPSPLAPAQSCRSRRGASRSRCHSES